MGARRGYTRRATGIMLESLIHFFFALLPSPILRRADARALGADARRESSSRPISPPGVALDQSLSAFRRPAKTPGAMSEMDLSPHGAKTISINELIT